MRHCRDHLFTGNQLVNQSETLMILNCSRSQLICYSPLQRSKQPQYILCPSVWTGLQGPVQPLFVVWPLHFMNILKCHIWNSLWNVLLLTLCANKVTDLRVAACPSEYLKQPFNRAHTQGLINKKIINSPCGRRQPFRAVTVWLLLGRWKIHHKPFLNLWVMIKTRS